MRQLCQFSLRRYKNSREVNRFSNDSRYNKTRTDAGSSCLFRGEASQFPMSNTCYKYKKSRHMDRWSFFFPCLHPLSPSRRTQSPFLDLPLNSVMKLARLLVIGYEDDDGTTNLCNCCRLRVQEDDDRMWVE
ncbi:hypothetical protein L1887_27122 [Cichorium endivia]|nr:hypothetical protein L1887_27122 [Cichorium endivia]